MNRCEKCGRLENPFGFLRFKFSLLTLLLLVTTVAIGLWLWKWNIETIERAELKAIETLKSHNAIATLQKDANGENVLFLEIYTPQNSAKIFENRGFSLSYKNELFVLSNESLAAIGEIQSEIHLTIHGDDESIISDLFNQIKKSRVQHVAVDFPKNLKILKSLEGFYSIDFRYQAGTRGGLKQIPAGIDNFGLTVSDHTPILDEELKYLLGLRSFRHLTVSENHGTITPEVIRKIRTQRPDLHIKVLQESIENKENFKLDGPVASEVIYTNLDPGPPIDTNSKTRAKVMELLKAIDFEERSQPWK